MAGPTLPAVARVVASSPRARPVAFWLGVVIVVAPFGLGLIALSVLSGSSGTCDPTGFVSGGVARGGGRSRGAGLAFGGPADHLGTGHVGASGVDLNAHPYSFAELGGTTFGTA